METIFHIVLGLLGLSFIILIHEFGHFIAAKCCKVHVERFCLFWGKPLISWKWGVTEFAIAWLPLGGYCKMKNESLALHDIGKDQIDLAKESISARKELQSSGKSFQDIGALQRIFIVAAGPFINILFTFFVLFSFQVSGYPELRHSNRVVVPNTSQVSEPSPLPQSPSPAEKAGLRSGDMIVRIGGKKIESFEDLSLAVALSIGENLDLEYLRDGKLLRGKLRSAASSEGRGWIGVMPWIDLVLSHSYDGVAKVQPGMRLEKINDQWVANWYEMLQLLRELGQEESVLLQWRSPTGELLQQNWDVAELGHLEFMSEIWVRSPNIWQALTTSLWKLKEMLSMQIKGLGQLFFGRLKLQNNLAGPIQISDQMGQIMTDAGSNFIQRWYNSWRFLSFISFMIALANLLPLAALDGGQILLYSVELLFRRRLPPRWVMMYQSVGSFVIIGLMVVVFSFELIYYVGADI